MERGIRFKPKPREEKPREPDYSTTSKARRELNYVRRTGTPEQIKEVEEAIAEKYPDLNQSRTEMI